MNQIYIQALTGGILIGLSAVMMLWLHGRIAGISGIVYGLLDHPKGDTAWRATFLIGLLAGGVVVSQIIAVSVVPREGFSNTLLLSAGLLVGIGTRVGGGCTSGHGVCGIARLSKRSLLATMVFMLSGITTVFVGRHLLGVL